MTKTPDHGETGEVAFVRCDHVLIHRGGFLYFVPCAGSMRGRWLVLMSSGEIRLYKGKQQPASTAKHRLLAASPGRLQARRGRLLRRHSLYVQLGRKRRRIAFDGREKAPSLIWLVIGAIPHIGEAAHRLHQLVEYFKSRKPRRDARQAWFPVLLSLHPATGREDVAAIASAT